MRAPPDDRLSLYDHRESISFLDAAGSAKRQVTQARCACKGGPSRVAANLLGRLERRNMIFQISHREGRKSITDDP